MASEDPVRATDSALETAAAPRATARSALSIARFTPGTLLAQRYRIVAPLGKGGMGEVYRADDVRLGQAVALKFLPEAVAADPLRLERLVDEVRIGRQISHPNVCRLYDIAEAEGHHFLVMEYVDGEDLASLLHRIGRLPPDKVLEIARGVCAGLAVAHDRGVIHRDLKPANVMIDGHGHARIADFGLAALVGSGAASGFAGTPAYMAPEQLAGGDATPRSDVFALGLVLHEMLTGQRVFAGKSLDELRRLHAETRPKSLSGSVKDVDPALERAVLSCLAADPSARPASARALLAALPGGDALQAALLAGETPSPEMVAAAGKVGDLAPAVAWGALALGLLGLWAITALIERGAVYRLAPIPHSPEVLEARAREILTRVGHEAAAVDSAGGFQIDFGFVGAIERSDHSPSRWQKLRTARPGAFSYYYRQSPRWMFANGWIPILPWEGPPELGRITRSEPPLDVPGMAEVVLDTRGRLTRFVLVPPAYDARPAPWPEVDWAVLLDEAGFDPAQLRASEPRWSAPGDSDRKVAWDGASRDQPEVVFHVEAASSRGRPVFLEVRGPWVRPPAGPAEVDVDPPSLAAALAVTLGSTVLLYVALLVLVRRNLRLGRGDRRGALRLALFTFATLVLAQALRADHTSVGAMEYALLIHIVGQGCYSALLVWAVYMGFEPAARRKWPHLLISWNRLMTGRVRDALVAADVLFGVVLGVAVLLAARLGAVAPAWFGGAPVLVGIGVLSALDSPRHVAHFVLMGACLGVVYSFGLLLQLYLLQVLIRRTWLARTLLFAFIALVMFATGGPAILGLVVATTTAGLLLFAMTRFGLLCSGALMFTFLVLLRVPLTLDVSAWYAGRSFAVLGLFAALLAAAAYTSLGGKPLFGKALLDE